MAATFGVDFAPILARREGYIGFGGLLPITDIIGSNRQKPAKDPTTSQTSAMTNGASCTRTFVAYLESKELCGMLARERTRDVRVQ
jgi:hypothetical protein